MGGDGAVLTARDAGGRGWGQARWAWDTGARGCVCAQFRVGAGAGASDMGERGCGGWRCGACDTVGAVRVGRWTREVRCVPLMNGYAANLVLDGSETRVRRVGLRGEFGDGGTEQLQALIERWERRELRVIAVFEARQFTGEVTVEGSGVVAGGGHGGGGETVGGEVLLPVHVEKP